MGEQALVDRCKAGDLRAFEEVYERYGRKLFGLCLRMSGSRSDAEDLMQEIFMTIFTKIKAFRGEARLSTWLYRIAVNTCISHIRKRRGEALTDQEQNLDSEPGGSAAEPLDDRAALKKAITRLPDGYRSAIVLHDIQGYNHKEIGEIMGISVGASKSQLFKARRRLRELLDWRAQQPLAVQSVEGREND